MKLSRITMTGLIFLFFCASAHASDRFLYSGDGKLSVKNSHTGISATLAYRDESGRLSAKAQADFDRVWGVPVSFHVAPRLISILDYIQDKYLGGALLVIDSGYRSPTHNENLRKKGKLAGQTSYHLEAMAADLGITRAISQKIWEEFRDLQYGGIGFYGSGELHVDSGKPRFWDAATALPKDKSPPENRNIYLNVDYDVYAPGEVMKLVFTGVSDFPIGVKKDFLLKKGTLREDVESLRPDFTGLKMTGECVLIETRTQSHGLRVTLPQNVKSGDYNIEATFCDPKTEKMPDVLLSRAFKINS